MKLLAFGHSHLNALRYGYGTLSSEERLPFSMDFIRINGQSDADTLLARIAADKSLAALVCSLEGNLHFLHGAVNYPRRFEFILPHAPDLAISTDAELIPYDMVWEKFSAMIGRGMTLIDTVKSRSDMPIYQISPPPPVNNSDAIINYINLIAARIPIDRARRMQQNLTTHGIAPATLQYKIWSVMVGVMSQLCRERAITFIEVPSVAKDNEGFLKEEYRYDGFHANPRYGQLIVRQLMEHLQQPKAAEE